MRSSRLASAAALVLWSCSSSNDAATGTDGGAAGGRDGSAVGSSSGSDAGAGSGADAGGRMSGDDDDGGNSKPMSCSGATTGVNSDLHGYKFFPASHPLNTPIDTLPVHPSSGGWMQTCAGGKTNIRPDYGMPYNVAAATTPTVTATALMYNGTPLDNPWRVPGGATLEGGPYANDGKDHHCLVLSLADCQVHEVYQLQWDDSGHTMFSGLSGTIWNTAGTGSATSSGADAAGLPILPTILREDELVAGSITHALRFTCQQTLHGYIAPARAFASNQTDATQYAPMGARARLKKSFDVTGGGAYSARVQALFRAMQTYGIINADNGSGFFITAAPNLVTDSPRVWTDDDDAAVKAVAITNLEFVDSGPIVTTE